MLVLRLFILVAMKTRAFVSQKVVLSSWRQWCCLRSEWQSC